MRGPVLFGLSILVLAGAIGCGGVSEAQVQKEIDSLADEMGKLMSDPANAATAMNSLKPKIEALEAKIKSLPTEKQVQYAKMLQEKVMGKMLGGLFKGGFPKMPGMPEMPKIEFK